VIFGSTAAAAATVALPVPALAFALPAVPLPALPGLPALLAAVLSRVFEVLLVPLDSVAALPAVGFELSPLHARSPAATISAHVICMPARLPERQVDVDDRAVVEPAAQVERPDGVARDPDRGCA
jgi:hypothetical protein